MNICKLCGLPITEPEYPLQRSHSVCQSIHRKERWRKYRREYMRKYYQRHKEELKKHRREYMSEYLLILKATVLTYYGGGRYACIRCGFADKRALSLDHINGRAKDDNLKGLKFYLYLKRNNYPPGYQTLCMNCQYIKKVEKGELGGYREEVRDETNQLGEMSADSLPALASWPPCYLHSVGDAKQVKEVMA